MKAAPKKIYFTQTENVHYYTEGIPSGRNYIEYICTDVFIEKAVVWISNNCYIPHSTLEDFKNYMKGE